MLRHAAALVVIMVGVRFFLYGSLTPWSATLKRPADWRQIALGVAHQGGARVIATCLSEGDREIAIRAGADEALLIDHDLKERLHAIAPDGVAHIVEVAFAANIADDIEMLAQGGSVATYATNAPQSKIPVWQLVFLNAKLFFVGSDDIPEEAKLAATRDLNEALELGWRGLQIAERFSLDNIAAAHESVEHPKRPGRTIVTVWLLRLLS